MSQKADISQTQIWRHGDRLPYHMRQFDQPYRSTVHLARFIQSLVDLSVGQALDVGCGAGANIFHLSQMLGDYQWTGVDIAGDELFPTVQSKFDDLKIPVQLLVGDFYRLLEIFPRKQFDLVLSIQTLMGIPDYEEAVRQMLGVTKGWLVISSLFTDFPVDARIQVMDYGRPDDCQGPFYYNVYSINQFRAFCERHGAKDFRSMDFTIDADLPQPEKYGMTTFTRKLENGERIQFSGPLHMPWKFVAVRMGES